MKKINRAIGELEISFSEDGISRLHCTAPLRAFGNDDGINEIPSAVIVNTSGGVVSGDRYDVTINVKKNSKGLILSQAADKIYKCLKNEYSEMNNLLNIDNNSWVEWIPQETIMFENANLKRNLEVNLSTDSEALIGEIVVLGRLAKGERVNNISLRDTIKINRNKKIEWLDRVLLDGKVHCARNSNARLYGNNCFFTIALSSVKISKYKDILYKFIENNINKIKISATILHNNLIIRGLSKDPLLLRKEFSKIWCFIRSEFKKLAPVMPKLWWI